MCTRNYLLAACKGSDGRGQLFTRPNAIADLAAAMADLQRALSSFSYRSSETASTCLAEQNLIVNTACEYIIAASLVPRIYFTHCLMVSARTFFVLKRMFCFKLLHFSKLIDFI